MEINVTVTKEQIRNEVLSWGSADILAFVKELDEWQEDWEFTVKLWYYLDELIERYKDGYIEQLIKECKS